MAPGPDLLDEGLSALGGGRWAEAADSLERTLPLAHGSDRIAVLDGLAEARWWLGESQRAVAAREEVYRTRRQSGDPAGAARAAAWLAREHAAGLANVPVARGWLRRAQTLAAEAADRRADGWVALAAAVLAEAAAEQAELAAHALRAARDTGDGDLEVLALGRLGLAEVVLGSVAAGLDRLDEAMAVVTAGEAELSTTAPELCCDFVLACELAGDTERFGRWADTVNRVAAVRGGPSPVTFCTTCCAEQAAARQDFRGAEQQLHLAVIQMTEPARTTRCLPPTVKLGELLLLQGRLEEAQQAVGERDDAPSLVVRARIALALGEPGVAETLARRAARREGPRAAAHAILVQARLDSGDVDGASRSLEELEAAVAARGDQRGRAQVELCRGRVALASGDVLAATAAFEAALDAVRGTSSLEVATAHLELARLRATDRPSVARIDAKAALSAFEGLGATQPADAAAALLRSLGDRTRVGPKDVGTLSRREEEVLRLVAQGLTNAEIASRLFISTKTAGNHVSSILAKLGARTRTEAAAYAALHSERAH